MTNNDGWTTKPVFMTGTAISEALEKDALYVAELMKPWQPDEQFMHSLEERLTVEVQKMNQHDPYLNPNSHLVYECADCPNELDPKTKSFAGLNNAAMIAGWKVRWGDVGYNAFCPSCSTARHIED